ncbi:multidrug resistance-associated protein 5 [Tanacetum coccineum]
MAQGTTKVRTGREGLTVDEGKKTCNCRMWQLSGIPYFHATKIPEVNEGWIEYVGNGRRSNRVAASIKRGAVNWSLKGKPMSKCGHKNDKVIKRLGHSKFVDGFGLHDDTKHTLRLDPAARTQADPVSDTRSRQVDQNQ